MSLQIDPQPPSPSAEVWIEDVGFGFRAGAKKDHSIRAIGTSEITSVGEFKASFEKEPLNLPTFSSDEELAEQMGITTAALQGVRETCR